MARQSRASRGALSGDTDQYNAAESMTASAEISHEAIGSGERNASRIG